MEDMICGRYRCIVGYLLSLLQGTVGKGVGSMCVCGKVWERKNNWRHKGLPRSNHVAHVLTQKTPGPFVSW